MNSLSKASVKPSQSSAPGTKILSDAWEYWADAAQRSLLFWDTLRQRGNIFLEHHQEGKPPTLSFDYELLIDGRTLEPPANYALVRIVPPAGVVIDPGRRPMVIVDPRAGHGPGIGGSKTDSQVGVALRAGHPVYFVMFFPEPVPGQTLAAIARAEALFLEEVRSRHPEAEKPCVIGNCQAGWAVAMLAAVKPEIMGPILLNGSPMSYWAGMDNKNPMRYAGGLLGGKWLATLMSDLGNGRFDGAYLVQNFENLNPANTLWSKPYGLYANIDTEQKRYLDFEKWWGGFFLLNAEEMDFIVSNLFIGNKLARGAIQRQDGSYIDLKNIRSPIVVFASHGDNITPPQQALNWIVDVYGSDEEILKYGQVIVYLLHEDIGHLGIFVSGAVARKQYTELVNTLEMIDRLPPGLYEMILEKKNPLVKYAERVPGDYTVRFEQRGIEDIRALDDAMRDEDYFTSLAAISEFNDQWYRTFLRPWVQAMTSEASAKLLRALNPARLQYYAWSDWNPWLAFLKPLAAQVQQQRKPVAKDNYFLSLERDISQNLVEALNAYRDGRDNLSRNLFKALYGPLGLGAWFPAPPKQGVQRDAAQEAALQAEIERLRAGMDQGGFVEAVVRIVLAGMEAQGMIDHRSHLIARELRQQYAGRLESLSPAAMKQLIRGQFYMLRLDQERALQSLARLLPTPEERREALQVAARVLMVTAEQINPEGPLARALATALELDPKQVLSGYDA